MAFACCRYPPGFATVIPDVPKKRGTVIFFLIPGESGIHNLDDSQGCRHLQESHLLRITNRHTVLLRGPGNLQTNGEDLVLIPHGFISRDFYESGGGSLAIGKDSM
jgi:hypothetical protein